MAFIHSHRMLHFKTLQTTRKITSLTPSSIPHLRRSIDGNRFLSDARPLNACVSEIQSHDVYHVPTYSKGRKARSIRVRPSGWQMSDKTQLLSLTLLGQTMPKNYTLLVEVFKLPETLTTTEQEMIIETLRAGLERTLEQYPILVGRLEWDRKSGEIKVRKNRDSELCFDIVHLDGNPAFPSFAQLQRRHFHANMIDAAKVLPYFTAGAQAAEGVPAAAFQLTFFSGGCTIGWAVHHQISDGACYEQFMSLWADNSRAAIRASTSSSTDNLELKIIDPNTQSTPVASFNRIAEVMEIKGSPLDAERPSNLRWKQIQHMFPGLTEKASAPRPEALPSPRVVSTMWHFPKKKVEQLKAETMAQVGEGEWISTYDAITALMWQSVTRARLEFLNPDMKLRSFLGHKVDIRKTLGISGRFMGVTSLPPQCGPLAIKELVKPANHAKVASTVRSSISSLTPELLDNFNQYVAGSSDKRRFRYNRHWFFGPDLGVSSWLHYQSYKKHNFGFGLPRAIRLPSPSKEYVYIFPSRRGVEGADHDEGIEVCVTLESGCAKRMLDDPMLKWYAKPRGNDPFEENRASFIAQTAEAGRVSSAT